jgi:CHAT domain-containing protein
VGTALNYFVQQACLDAPTLNVDQVDQTAAVIYPIILNNRLDVILSLPGSPLQHYSTPVSAAKLTEISDRLQQALYQDPLRRGIFSTDTLLPLAQQLYNWLIRPAESAIAASHVQTLVQKLIETNSSKAEALRYAQRHFLDHPDFHHPFFWSPYILVGNWL